MVGNDFALFTPYIVCWRAKSYYNCSGSYDSTRTLVCDDIFCYVEIAMVAIYTYIYRQRGTNSLDH